MAAAAAGAWIDERTELGFSTWRAACRSAGLTVGSLLTFTAELLPTAVTGALAGGLVVLFFGLARHREGCAATTSLAAHAGCLVGMTVGLWLCTLALPIPILLGAEVALAAGCAAWLSARLERVNMEQLNA